MIPTVSPLGGLTGFMVKMHKIASGVEGMISNVQFQVVVDGVLRFSGFNRRGV